MQDTTIKYLSTFGDASLYEELFNESRDNAEDISYIVIASYNSNIKFIEDQLNDIYKAGFMGNIIILLGSGHYNKYTENEEDFKKMIKNTYTLMANHEKIEIIFSKKNHAKFLFVLYDNKKESNKLLISSQNLTYGRNIEVGLLISDDFESKNFVSDFIECFRKDGVNLIYLHSYQKYCNLLSQSIDKFSSFLDELDYLAISQDGTILLNRSMSSVSDIGGLSKEIGNLIINLDSFLPDIQILLNQGQEVKEFEQSESDNRMLTDYYSLINSINQLIEDSVSRLELLNDNINELIDIIGNTDIDQLFSEFAHNFQERLQIKYEEGGMTKEKYIELDREFSSHESGDDPAGVYHNYFEEEDIDSINSLIIEKLEMVPSLGEINNLPEILTKISLNIDSLYKGYDETYFGSFLKEVDSKK